MKGKRIHPDQDGHFPKFDPGDFLLWKGEWYGSTPNGYRCSLRNHRIIEHQDGTITAEPSIRVSISNTEEVWHGYLEQGTWRTC